MPGFVDFVSCLLGSRRQCHCTGLLFDCPLLFALARKFATHAAVTALHSCTTHHRPTSILTAPRLHAIHFCTPSGFVMLQCGVQFTANWRRCSEELLANGLSKPYRISSNNSRHTLRARLALADHTHRPSQFLSAAALVTASKLAAEQS